MEKVQLSEIRKIIAQVLALSKEFKDVKETLSAHTRSLMTIENLLKYYTDMFELNRGDIKKLAYRVNNLESKVSIEPLPEFTVAGL